MSHSVWGNLHTFGLVKISVLNVTATYYDKYCCVELGTGFTFEIVKFKLTSLYYLIIHNFICN